MITHLGVFQYLPEIRFFAGAYQPGNWQFADGRLLQITPYEGLFQIIGTAFGGDGQADFALPDLRGRVLIGAGTGVGLANHVLAQSFGEEGVTLLSDTPAIHSHTLPSGLGFTGINGSGAPFPNHQPTLTLRYAIATAGIFPMPESTNTDAVPTLGEIRPFASNATLPERLAVLRRPAPPHQPEPGAVLSLPDHLRGQRNHELRAPRPARPHALRRRAGAGADGAAAGRAGGDGDDAAVARAARPARARRGSHGLAPSWRSVVGWDDPVARHQEPDRPHQDRPDLGDGVQLRLHGVRRLPGDARRLGIARGARRRRLRAHVRDLQGPDPLCGELLSTWSRPWTTSWARRGAWG